MSFRPSYWKSEKQKAEGCVEQLNGLQRDFTPSENKLLFGLYNRT